MQLYYKNFHEFQFDNLVYLNKGGCGKVYRCESGLLKIYNPDCSYFSKIKLVIFDKIKHLNAPNVVKLNECFFRHRFHIKRRPDAYTMNEIVGIPISLIDCDRKFIIEIFRQFEHTLQILSENNIVVEDIHSKNILINENGIYIIDPDLFYKWGIFDIASAYRINKAKLRLYFNAVLREQLYERADASNSVFIKSNPNNTLLEDLMLSMTEDTVLDSMLSNSDTIKFKPIKKIIK